MAEQQGTNVLYRLREIEKLLGKHDQDIYRGNGKPGLVTRILQQEEAMEQHEEQQKEEMGKRDRADERLKNWIVSLVFLVLATLFTLIGNLVKGHL